ncbi:putative phage-associated protein [Parabacteroides sp. PF5-5]|uniref:Panacea domain-containing protein n=1 Tax=unclassified Parabacteroides TaxID=2649774 RepID=UPI002472FD40|nr:MULTISPECIES: type II toxin-antitoxin system antitoxin SocA domain-containing protein [unclassified Parabacteroides]MDH6305183.1 putative phage-associated protein [Parabacteroides sp. PH5-39]MDH6316533.1 putative phage-associated protein [Parabacteroides sp. PF5-13]MDH6320043.1 putative phage-associated protein [Parabacteroides sp. PH5-13]MDH6323724.1 putative phage-associated protein [Parabacteroides sp. PH5-8]MDH6327720.1 putative phage-associated protein [Parabacteroides sp. PH5-41]
MGIIDIYKYNSVDIAKFIAAYANKHKYTINMTKIQKLLYIAYGTYLSVKNERLVDEHPQAWPYGPVFPTTRNKLSKTVIQSISYDDPDVKKNSEDSTLSSLITLVFNSFGQNNAVSLSEWSHKKGSPWEKTTIIDGFKWGDIIPDKYIKDYFDTIVVKKDDE